MQGGVIRRPREEQEYTDECQQGTRQASRRNKMTIQIVKVQDTVHAGAPQIYPSGANYALWNNEEPEYIYLSGQPLASLRLLQELLLFIIALA